MEFTQSEFLSERNAILEAIKNKMIDTAGREKAAKKAANHLVDLAKVKHNFLMAKILSLLGGWIFSEKFHFESKKNLRNAPQPYCS